MALVDYSDSDASETEAIPKAKSPTNSAKPVFQKVVDRSNSGKIRVSLPGTATTPHINEGEPPTKRAKIGEGGGGGFSGFNSFLPPPKRTGVTSKSGLRGGGAIGRSGLAAGVSLKTGAAPGFSREQQEIAEPSVTDEGPGDTQISSASSLPPPTFSPQATHTPADEVKLVGKPLMFKPLSVSRNPKKKKLVPKVEIKSTTQDSSEGNGNKTTSPPPKKPKISLFSAAPEVSDSYEPTPDGEYKPMIFGAAVETDEGETQTQDDIYNYQYSQYTEPPRQAVQASATAGAQSLDDIASDMGLSAADRRQLFGRQKGSRGAPSAHKIINFNTDQEYQHNEELRAAGEQVVHNPVRAIAPGKHNLKQLVNAAASQKEALEESFAKGKSNRAEASSRYGW